MPPMMHLFRCWEMAGRMVAFIDGVSHQCWPRKLFKRSHIHSAKLAHRKCGNGSYSSASIRPPPISSPVVYGLYEWHNHSMDSDDGKFARQ
ncbi:hypothetical protein CCHR01_16957 [Colletotrichum chrysophilum]|uniref:Uncharacterized protein n=1 Tax=Colletotrichum chrysophilum TaxID=1836956 RepID=A0AAD9A4N7_9PEZI|nr:hypothetical protein CCHR01_16957 [Colletotrichum chrysophilum]